MKSDTQWVIDSMRVKTPGHRTQIGSLSGGNQQKVIIGRWLLTQPEILMLDEPTRGIDVGAKFEIYQLIAELAKKGKGDYYYLLRNARVVRDNRPYSGHEQWSRFRNCRYKNNNAKRNSASCVFAPLRLGASHECVK